MRLGGSLLFINKIEGVVGRNDGIMAMSLMKGLFCLKRFWFLGSPKPGAEQNSPSLQGWV